MLSGLNIALLLWVVSRTYATGQPCQCSALQPAGLKVNCSFSNLMELPGFPSDTTELFVQDNKLTSVPPGLFDRLVGLEKVSLADNPFHCDCRIQYLRNWLLRNKAIVSKEPTCTSPVSVAHRAISDLNDDFFSSCAETNYTGGTFNTVIGVMLCCLIVLLLWSLRLAKMSTITLYVDERHSGFEAVSLRPLRPKRRRRMNSELLMGSQRSDSLTCVEELEKPLLNMELLPQVLDTLHKKHNIKVHLREEPHSGPQWNYKNTASGKKRQ